VLLEESARRAGQFAWLEARLFEVLGRWVTSTPEAAVKVHLAAESRHHAWHAELWRQRLPVAAGFDPDRLVMSPNDALAAAVEGLRGADMTAERLAALYGGVLPALVTAYRDHLAATDAVADGPTIRWLGFILEDETAHQRAGDELLESLHNPG
jgi:hypothetical protein